MDSYQEERKKIESLAARYEVKEPARELAHFPGRTEAETIRKLNSMQKRTREARFLPPEDAITDLYRHRPPLPADKARSWIEHPCEEVRLEFIVQGYASKRDLALFDSVIEKLVSKAWADAQEAREVWNPMLDALAAQEIWPSMVVKTESRDEVGQEERSLDNKGGRDEDGKVIPTLGEYLLHTLAVWAASRSVEEGLEFMTRFQAVNARGTVAEFMPKPTPEVLEKWVQEQPELLFYIIKRRDLDSSDIDIILEGLVKNMERLNGYADVEGVSSKQYRGRDESPERYIELIEKGARLSEEQVYRLFDALPSSPYKNSKGEVDEKRMEGIGALRMLLGHVMFTHERNAGRRLIAYLSRIDMSHKLALLLDKDRRHPGRYYVDIDEELALDIAKRALDKPGVLMELAARDDVQTYESVRDVLKRSKHVGVLRELMKEARESEFRELFLSALEGIKENFRKGESRRWGGSSAAGQSGAKMKGMGADGNYYDLSLLTAVIIEEHKELAARTLKSEDISFLLNAEDRDVRVIGIDLLGRIREGQDTERVRGKIRRH